MSKKLHTAPEHNTTFKQNLVTLIHPLHIQAYASSWHTLTVTVTEEEEQEEKRSLSLGDSIVLFSAKLNRGYLQPRACPGPL